MREIKLLKNIDGNTLATSQILTVNAVGQKRLKFHFKFVTLINRWVFDLEIDDVRVLLGQKVVLDTNLLAPFGFGVGALVASNFGPDGTEPGLDELTNSVVRLFLISPAEQQNLLAAD